MLDYLNTKVKAKNKEKLQGLIEYIEKHQEEIINYDRRKKARKKIGSEKDDDDGDNQLVSNVQTFKKADSVENACDNVIKKYLQSQEVSLNQERENIDLDIQNQSSFVQIVKKVVGSVCSEKACDSVIGKRQKHFAKSFRKWKS